MERLPNRVEVFHGFNWLTRTRAGTIQEGECDFVLLDANHGLLFVEVKGGSLLFDGRQWVRIVRGEERLLNKDPFAQAQRGMHDIVGLVKDQFGRAGGNLPFTYSFAVAFPDCRSKGGDPGRGGGADAGVRAAWGLSTSSMPSWSTRDRTFTNCSGEAPSSTVTANS